MQLIEFFSQNAAIVEVVEKLPVYVAPPPAPELPELPEAVQRKCISKTIQFIPN